MQFKTAVKFTLTNNGIFKIDNEVLPRLCKYLQISKDDAEAGGVLLGRFLKDSKNIIVDHISVPMIGDKRSRFSFVRNKKMHQKIIDNEWLKSNGTCNYVGEWHTHPEDYPTPSNVDTDNWKNRLKQDKFSTRYLYFMIVGLKEIRVWEGDKRTLTITKLKKL